MEVPTVPVVLPEFSVVTFNTLRRNYDFGKKYWVPEEAKVWETRRGMLENLMLRLNADIFCLQEAEVTTIEEDFGFLLKNGYNMVRAREEKEIPEHSHTKPSIFYKTSKFELKWLNPRSRIVLANFEEKSSGLSFYIINAHLQGGNQQDQRCFQMRSALQQLQIHAKKSKIPEDKLSCFLCGDFNSNSSEPIHNLIKNGKISQEDITKYFPKSGFHFEHKYQFQDSNTSNFYTFKWGVKEDAIFETIDFIYYTPRTLQLVAVRDPLSQEQRSNLLDRCGIPNAWNPSDHLPLAAVFKFIKE